MEFIVGFPYTRRQCGLIWIIVDRMMKSTHLVPINVLYSVENGAKLYLGEMVRLHRVPLSIFDCGTQFTSQFLRSFQKGLGTRLKLSMDFHP